MEKQKDGIMVFKIKVDNVVCGKVGINENLIQKYHNGGSFADREPLMIFIGEQVFRKAVEIFISKKDIQNGKKN